MISVLLVLAFAAPPELPIIVAEVSSQCALSSLAVYSSGVAHIQESNTCQAGSDELTASLRKVTPAELRKLTAAIEAAHFESLPTEIQPDPQEVSTDEDVFLIRVWRGGRAKLVRAFGLGRAQDRDAAKRFQALWASLKDLGLPEVKQRAA